ncbi:MAG: transcription termination factor Rho [Planctomycetia bacterium]|nr:transcription termination factor Rho [Planctomycetia bacterium]
MTPRPTGSDGTPRKKKAPDAAPRKAAGRRSAAKAPERSPEKPSAKGASKPASKAESKAESKAPTGRTAGAKKDAASGRATAAAAGASAERATPSKAGGKKVEAKPTAAKAAAKAGAKESVVKELVAKEPAAKPSAAKDAAAPDLETKPARGAKARSARRAADADEAAAPAPLAAAEPRAPSKPDTAATADERPASFSAPAPRATPAPALPIDEDGWVPLSGEPTEPVRGPVAALPTDEEGWEPIDESPAPRPAQGARPSIPPLPDDDEFAPDDRGDGRGDGRGDDRDDDEFEPLDGDDADDGPPRTPPPGATPRQVYDAVRRGDLHVAALDALPDDVLVALAADVGLEARPGERRPDLLYRLLNHQPAAPEPPTYETEGVLELVPEGFGFLRSAAWGYYVGPFDPYVPVGVVRKLGLSVGHFVTGTARAPRPGERYPTLVHVESVNHEEPEVLAKVVPFDRLTVTHPDRRYVLETAPEETAMRVVDLFCPLGRGQRALIVSPPRAGKTILLQKIADSVARNYPEVEIVVLLVDERPEEVTNMRRSVRGEVIASTFDQPPHRHIRVAELAIEKVKRMVELGRHVVLLIDSLTRLGRAYNNETGGGGRLLTGGLEATALTKPKRFFGAARNIEHGGSLTIVASALVDTGSRLDQVIFEEFKGTGNMEIVLSRDIANQRVWPAIDVAKSGTRREDLLLHPEEQRRIVALRRDLLEQDPAEAMVEIVTKMAKHKTNAELLMRTSVD